MITEYYTAARFSPVKTIAKATLTGHATNIIQGLAVLQSTALPVLVIVAGILVANEPRRGLYGIAVAVMASSR